MKYLYAISTLAAAVVVAFGAPALSPKPAETPKKVSMPAAAYTAPKAEVESDADDQRAQVVLKGLAETYKDLDNVTVSMGATPKGEEAVSYYTVDQILIDKDHTVSIEKILAHEVWHIIDWHDNGRLDWGEDLPPKNSSDYFRN